jgi:glycosyltransferase involved in cell wall biosynthesis
VVAIRSLSASVIVPTHDRHRSLVRLLESLRDTDRVREVIVVDDGSMPPVSVVDSLTRVVRNESPQLVSTSRNRGAVEARGDILLFADDDCVFGPDVVRLLTQAFERDSQLGIAGPAICYWSRPAVLWCAGTVMTKWTGRTILRGNGQDPRAAHLFGRACSSFPTCFAVRRKAFCEVAGFDAANFPAHMGEGELAERLMQRGYRVQLVPDAVVWHDMDPGAALARRLHVTTAGAFDVGRSRGTYIRRYSPSFACKVTRLLFWLAVLVPVYLSATLCSPWAKVGARVAAAQVFLRGTWHGLFDKWQDRRPSSARH